MSQGETIVVLDDGDTLNEHFKRVLKKRSQRKAQVDFPPPLKAEGILEKLNFFFNKEKCRASKELEFYSKITKLDPQNTKAHLKMAELFQKQKDGQKAIGEYLMAGEIFYQNKLFPQAMAVYKQVLKKNPGLDHVHKKIADIYRQMGFLGDAFYRYNLLLQQYNHYGEKEKSTEIMDLMAELDPRKFNLEEKLASFTNILDLQGQECARGNSSDFTAGDDLRKENLAPFFDLGEALEANSPLEIKGYKEISTDKIHGFMEIFQELKETAGPSKAYPNFNYNMGVACREMGFIEEAIEQFQAALEKKQNPFEAAKSLSWCLKEKGWWEEAKQALETALQIEGMTEEKTVEIEKELDFINRELEREKQTLGCLNDYSSNHSENSERARVCTGFGIGEKMQESLSA
jgi:tetratricopeptide (TPR) repeat protein